MRDSRYGDKSGLKCARNLEKRKRVCQLGRERLICICGGLLLRRKGVVEVRWKLKW